jgi:hypothetical protein
MGYEVKFIFHPRKEEGGYNTEIKEEKLVKVGKPFDETPLEKLAGVIMSQMARRDIWVVDVEAVELVRKELNFKECKDGRGIVLKNKKFSFNEAAQMVAEDMGEPDAQPQPVQPPQQGLVTVVPANMPVAPGQHPHEALVAARAQQSMEDLYGNPNRPVPVQRQTAAVARAKVDPKKVLYHVYFEPYFYEKEVKRLSLKFTPDRKYPVHAVIPSPDGRLDAQRLAVTDDLNRVVEVDEKYFTSAGMGLMADKQLGFSGQNGRGVRKPKLAYEDEMYMDAPDPKMAGMAIPQGIPIDDGTVPADMLQMPDIRPGKRTR